MFREKALFKGVSRHIFLMYLSKTTSTITDIHIRHILGKILIDRATILDPKVFFNAIFKLVTEFSLTDCKTRQDSRS